MKWCICQGSIDATCPAHGQTEPSGRQENDAKGRSAMKAPSDTVRPVPAAGPSEENCLECGVPMRGLFAHKTGCKTGIQNINATLSRSSIFTINEPSAEQKSVSVSAEPAVQAESSAPAAGSYQEICGASSSRVLTVRKQEKPSGN